MYVCSKPSPYETRGSGKIIFTYQYEKVGTKKLGNFTLFTDDRRNMQVTATLKTGEQILRKYDYYLDFAGSLLHPYTIIWEDQTDDRDCFWHCNNNDIAVDNKVYTIEMPVTGIKLELTNEAWEASGHYSEKYSYSLEWKYENFRKALLGNDNYALAELPPNGETMTITWGSKGMAFDGKDECEPCGDEPHAGVKMKFSYKFVEVP